MTYQDCVRAHVATIYPRLLDENVAVDNGTIALPERAGIGARWLPELFHPDTETYRITRL